LNIELHVKLHLDQLSVITAADYALSQAPVPGHAAEQAVRFLPFYSSALIAISVMAYPSSNQGFIKGF